MFERLLSNLLLLALHLDNSGLFPPPLKPAQEQELLKQYSKGNNLAKEKLIRHNLRLVAHIIKKYYSTESENEELISVGTVGLIKAINTFNPEKGVRLATYASRCIENEILMYFRNQKKNALDISFDEPIETDSEGNPLTLIDIIAADDDIIDDIITSSSIKKMIKYINELTDKRERDLLIMRYGLDGKEPRTQNYIAEKYGISRSYVSRLETKILKKLKKRFDQDHLF